MTIDEAPQATAEVIKQIRNEIKRLVKFIAIKS